MELISKLLPALVCLISCFDLVRSREYRRLVLAKRQATLDGRPLPNGFRTASETLSNPSRVLSFYNSHPSSSLNNRASHFKSSHFQNPSDQIGSDPNFQAQIATSRTGQNGDSYSNLINTVLGVTPPPIDSSMTTTADVGQSVNGWRDKTELGFSSAVRSNSNNQQGIWPGQSGAARRTIPKIQKAGIFADSD